MAFLIPAAAIGIADITSLATESAVGILSGTGGIISNMLNFVGANAILSDIVEGIQSSNQPAPQVITHELPKVMGHDINPLNQGGQKLQQITHTDLGGKTKIGFNTHISRN